MRDYPALIVRAASPDEALADLVAAAVDDFGVVAMDEVEAGTAVRAFFSSPEDRDAAKDALAGRFPGAAVEPIDVSDEDWAARSQAALTAVRVGALTVAPPWDIPGDDASSTIVILPSTGFGTGHHATTRLCLAALQRAETAGKSVIDVGTGSGVLAIAAAKLGAARAAGIDNDQDAIDNALENRLLNASAAVAFTRAGVEDAVVAGPFDVVVANLTGGVLIRFAHAIAALGEGGGHVILSGLREEEEADVLAAFGRPLLARESEDGWVCLVIRTGP